MAFGDFLELGKDAGLAIGNAAKSAGSGLLDYGKSMLSPVTNAWNYVNNYGQIKQLRQEGASFANDAHAVLSNNKGSAYNEFFSPWLSQGQKEAVARLGKDAKLISSQEDLDYFKKDSSELFDDAWKTKAKYDKTLSRTAGKFERLSATTAKNAYIRETEKLAKKAGSHAAGIAGKDALWNVIENETGYSKQTFENQGYDLAQAQKHYVPHAVDIMRADKSTMDKIESARQTASDTVINSRKAGTPTGEAEKNASIRDTYDTDYTKRLDTVKANYKQQIDNETNEDKKKDLKKQKSKAIETFKKLNKNSSEAQDMYKKAREQSHAEYAAEMEKVKAENPGMSEKELAKTLGGGKRMKNRTTEIMAKQFEKAGMDSKSAMKHAQDTIDIARTAKKADIQAKHIDQLVEQSKKMKTVEGRKEFVEKNAKATGWEKGAKAAKGGGKLGKLAKGGGKLGKLATMAVGGVAVAGALMGLGSVGTARMMMAGGQQPNSNLYNPYQASY